MADLRLILAPMSLITLPVLFLAACAGGHERSSAGPEPRAAATQQAPKQVAGQAASPSDDVERAIAALRQGDHRRALELVQGLAFQAALGRMRAALDGGDPRDALAPGDEALGLRPDDSEALYLRALAAFRVADAGDPQAGFFYGDARAGFEAAARRGHGVDAAFLAARAAYMAGDAPGALDLARQGMRWLDGAEGRAVELPLELTPERIWSDAAFGAYTAAVQAGEGDAAALFAETEDALGRLAAEHPTDPRALEQLANLSLWAGRKAEAIGHLEAAVALAPETESAHNALVRELRAEAYAASIEASGAPAEAPPADAPAAQREAYAAAQAAAVRAQRDAVIAYYDAFQIQNPQIALGFWYGAAERFERALEDYERGSLQAAEFHRAERDYRRCRELNDAYEETCRGWEVIARLGGAWSRFWGGDLAGATEAFWSTEEVLEGGLDWQYEGRLASALVGLATVAGKYAERTDDVDALTTAAGIGDALFARRPENANLANNAGFLNRDAAVLYAQQASAKRLAAQRAATDGERETLRAEAKQLRERAQQIMERSWAAYQVAARLAPDDVRVVNDTGLVMAYYLRTDKAAARHYFVRAVDLGQAQIENLERRGEDVPEDLRIAYGDAHQNLGILALTFENDLVSARSWFEKALQVAPDPRPELEEVMPALEASIAAGAWTDELRAFERMMIWKD